jgi:hypothetical protein
MDEAGNPATVTNALWNVEIFGQGNFVFAINVAM